MELRHTPDVNTNTNYQFTYVAWIFSLVTFLMLNIFGTVDGGNSCYFFIRKPIYSTVNTYIGKYGRFQPLYPFLTREGQVSFAPLLILSKFDQKFYD